MKGNFRRFFEGDGKRKQCSQVYFFVGCRVFGGFEGSIILFGKYVRRCIFYVKEFLGFRCLFRTQGKEFWFGFDQNLFSFFRFGFRLGSEFRLDVWCFATQKLGLSLGGDRIDLWFGSNSQFGRGYLVYVFLILWLFFVLGSVILNFFFSGFLKMGLEKQK